MKRFSILFGAGVLLLLLLLFPAQAASQQRESYDYWGFNRNVISTASRQS